jgi:hypothetical protein
MDLLDKLRVSWNSGLSIYSTSGPLRMGLYRRLRWKRLIMYPGGWHSPDADRPVDVSARFGATYNKATVRYQRERLREALSGRVETGKLGRRAYMNELKTTKVVVSPFGWGEITLKDFEVFLTGGLLLKPSMDHLDTWPPLYERHRTYIAHEWDLRDFDEKLAEALADHDLRLRVAADGQKRYQDYLVGPEAGERFAERFLHLVA